MKTLNRALNGFMAALFLILAALQHSSNNPVGWMALFIAIAVPCALAVQGRLVWTVAAISAAAGLLWIAGLAAGGALPAEPTPEALAALVGTLWVASLAVVAFRARSEAAFAYTNRERTPAWR